MSHRAANDLIRNVSREISPRDEMFEYGRDWDNYLWIATSALKCIRRSMDLTGTGEPQSILDMASGHGRVLRVLKVAFPAADLTACDINRDGVEFCARTFGATPVVSDPDPHNVRLGGRFDLVWCGSLFTHLDAPRWDGFLALIESALAPGGLFVFTVFGRQIADGWRAGAKDPQLTADDIAQILRGYDDVGFGYADYPGATGWGDAVVKPAWVRDVIGRRPRLRLIEYQETGWVGSQDVVTCVSAAGAV